MDSIPLQHSPDHPPSAGAAPEGADALLPHHRRMLEVPSGISPAIIRGRGYQSIHGAESYAQLRLLGFAHVQCRLAPGLLVPILDRRGAPVQYQFRPDTPRTHGRSGKPIKYETVAGRGMRLNFGVEPAAALADPAVPLVVTEGVKKGDCLRTHGYCVVVLAGVWNWRGSNAAGGRVALPGWEDVALNGREVFLVFDSDVATKRPVRQALDRLRGLLASRGARVRVVELPQDGGDKVGVDDYLVAHGRCAFATLIAQAREQPATAGVQAPRYQRTNAGLVWVRPTGDGDTPVLLTNFTAEIVGDIVEHDGVEATRHFELSAAVGGRHQRFRVAANDFPSLAWVAEQLGARAIVTPGAALKDHVRAAIQSTSAHVVERRVFTHTGWHQSHDGVWYYFHGGGILGAGGHVPNMEVALSGGLRLMSLPEPPRGEALAAAVKASVRLLEVAPFTVTIPLWLAVWRAALGRVDGGLHVAGASGAGKSELTALAQQHYGAGFDRTHLPGSWFSTDNAPELLAFQAKDMVVVIDDFCPKGTAADISGMHSRADRLFRALGNGSSRGRLRRDLSAAPARPPRGLIISSGEDLFQGQSLRARVLTLEFPRDGMRWDQLAACQADAAAGLYAQAMAAYLQWLVPCYEAVQRDLPGQVRALRQEFSSAGQHQRTPEAVAHLLVGLSYFLAFARDVGALTAAECQDYRNLARLVLEAIAHAQTGHHDDDNPAQRFLALVRGALASGKAHIAGITGQAPRGGAEAFGWRPSATSGAPGDGDAAVAVGYTPLGDLIGWVDGDALYLEPDSAYRIVQLMARDQQQPLPVGRRMLQKALAEAAMLKSTEKGKGRDTYTSRKTCGGVRNRPVLHLWSGLLTGVAGN
jgi:Domain of unknown function (DUF3854)